MALNRWILRWKRSVNGYKTVEMWESGVYTAVPGGWEVRSTSSGMVKVAESSTDRKWWKNIEKNTKKNQDELQQIFRKKSKKSYTVVPGGWEVQSTWSGVGERRSVNLPRNEIERRKKLEEIYQKSERNPTNFRKKSKKSYNTRWVGGPVNVVGGRRAKVCESSTDIFIPHTKEPNTSVLTSTFLAWID